MKDNKFILQDITQYLIAYCNAHNLEVTPLRLQKYLFYAQGWYLARYDKPLFDDDFEAWTYGPVVPELYRKLKKFGDSQLPAMKMPAIPLKLKAFLNGFVIKQYARLSLNKLLKMVHNEPSYKEARGDLPSDAMSDSLIDKDIIRTTFKKKTFNGHEFDEEFLAVVEETSEEYGELYERLA